MSGTVESKEVRAGGYLMLEAASITAPDDSDDGVETKIFLVVDDRLVGFVTFADQIRKSSAGAIDMLKKTALNACY